MQLETNRLKIVSFQAELFMPLYQLFCENETVMKSAFKGRTLSKKEFLDVLSNNFILNDEDQIGFVCVLDKTTENFIGFTGLIPCNFLGDEDDLEFGFVLHQDYWGKGFATEIGQFWIDFTKNELQLNRILAAASPDNHASINAIKKLGLTEVKEISTENRGSRLVFSKEF
ncbi:GNAT family N-acetyltransferase [Zunongwangia sp. HGR-M22]|uniref:GNAT family N-acetyltransferase n=1 Tax=Zunongwangia sp. HGR-M22 TaxID=3015168 RepID=UPI0022DD82A3|nr:GNAT family N-acetyltransferase [Zunongwangia sp. HGR-M22]WBL25756.1 GNAT family N-acetyltransferase [Zunongwangia sp. HGR-M22]